MNRDGTISNFGSILISIFSQISLSISRSISILYLEKNQYQDQYQYQYFSKPNIKIKINIFSSLSSISILASISSKYWYWYWKSIFYQRTFIALKFLLDFTMPDNENMKIFVKNDVLLRLTGSYNVKIFTYTTGTFKTCRKNSRLLQNCKRNSDKISFANA